MWITESSQSLKKKIARAYKILVKKTKKYI